MTTPSPDTVAPAPAPAAAPPSADTVAPTVAYTAAAGAGGRPTIAGYDVQELIGRGGMGRVYRARHHQLGRTVAIKVMTQEQDERLTARFRDEARAVAKLQHPNIAQLFDTGTADGRPYYSLEFADGGTLAGRWAGKPQDPTAAAATMECVARAIQYSHEHGILHRDLKPGNVLLAGDGTPKVADFGLAKELPSVAPGDTTLPGLEAHTRTGEIVGTPAYMPPEQASGINSTLTAAADVYALGAMLYEALTGRPPFQAPDPLQTLFLVLSTEPVPPKALQPKLPADLNTICMKCLEKQAKKRYATAGELADDLRRWRGGEPIVARPVGVVERAVKWARRNKAGAALVGMSGVLLLAVVGFGVWETFDAARLQEANDQLAARKAEAERANEELAVKNAELEKAKAESDKSFALATGTIDSIVRDTTLKLNGMPNGEALQMDLLARQSELNRRLWELRPEDAGAGQRYRSALTMRTVYETGYGRHAEAARTRQELLDHLRVELARTPDDPTLRSLEVRAAVDASLAANALGNKEQARKERAELTRLAKRFIEQFPTHKDVGHFTIQQHVFRGFDAADDGDTDGRLKALRDSVAVARQLPDPGERFTYLSSGLSQLGIVLSTAGKPDEAETVFAEAHCLYSAGAPGADPKGAVCRRGTAGVVLNRASLAMNGGRKADAAKLYAEAEPLLRGLMKDFPLTLENRTDLADCLYFQGYLMLGADNPAALKRIEEAVALLDDELTRRSDANVKDIRDSYAKSRDNLAAMIRQKK